MKLKAYVPVNYEDKSIIDLPKIYFSSHPDNTFYISEVIDLARKSCECAIWYPENSEDEWAKSELYGQLGEMDLFAVPITGRLLREPNRARDVEIPFAMERHIPILFLLLEKGCEKDFSRVFGDIQYLSPLVKSADGVTYEERAEDFLKSTLASTELRKRVESAFDAHSFLSYRKKDRTHALRLMEAIHSQDALLPLAIWYDDFLTPGEDFNNTIATAIEKSDLFLLAVTPNITEAENYVMRLEYPRASDMGKAIIPIELLATERKELFTSYPELSEPIDINDTDALCNAILLPLGEKIKSDRIPSGEKDYLLGTAYLHGIGVEKNVTAAIKLLENSARGGSTDAIETLVRIYRNGQSVTESKDAAIKWQSILVGIYDGEYNTAPSEKGAYVYLSELNYLGILYGEAGEKKKGEDTLRFAVSELESAVKIYGGVRLSHLLSRVYRNLGDVLAKASDVGARELYVKALCILENAHKDKNECLFCSSIAFSLGKFLYGIDEKRESFDYYKMAVEYREEQFTNESTQSEWSELEDCYDTLSECADETHGLDEAIGILDRAEKTFSYLCDDGCDPSKRYCYFKILSKKAKIFNKNGNRRGAEKYYLRMIRELEKDCKEIRSQNDWFFICSAYRSVADFYLSAGDIESAGKYLVDSFEKPLRIIEKSPLLDRSEHYFVIWNSFELVSLGTYSACTMALDELCRLGIDFCENMLKVRSDIKLESIAAMGYRARANIRTLLNDHEGALECIKRACNLTESEYSEPSEPIEWLNRATYLRIHAINFENLGDVNSAAAMMELSLYAMEQFVRDEPYEVREREVAYTCSVLADYYIRLEQFEKAEPQLLRAYRYAKSEKQSAISEPDGQESGSAGVTDSLGADRLLIIYGGALMNLYCEWGRWEKAICFANEHRRIIDRLEALNTPNTSKRDRINNSTVVFDGYINLVSSLLKSKNFTEAKECSDNAIRFLNRESEVYTPAPVKVRALYENHGNACLEVGEYEEGRLSFLRVADILKGFIDPNDSYDYDSVNLAKIYSRLSELLRRAKEEEQSLEYARECMQILEKSASEHHTHYAYQTWIEQILSLGKRIGYRVEPTLLADARKMIYRLYTENPDNPKHKRLYSLSLEIAAYR